MPDIWVPIVVAMIGGPLMWGLRQFDKRNTKQHERGMDVIYRVEDKVDGIRHDFSDHLQWHLKDKIQVLDQDEVQSDR